jgi:MraZ protein
LDEKFRFALPKPIRAAVQQGGAETRFFVAPGTDGCLAIYTEESFQSLGERLADGPPTGPDVRAFGRLFYAQAQGVELDGQGRMRLPAELVVLARLNREIVIIGVRDHIEIWNTEQWEKYLREKQEQYDRIAEQAFRRP